MPDFAQLKWQPIQSTPKATAFSALMFAPVKLPGALKNSKVSEKEASPCEACLLALG